MKKVIKIDGNPAFEFNGLIDINYLKDYVKEMKDLKHTHINIFFDDGYKDVCFTPCSKRLETDAEYAQRLSRDADYEENIKIHELKELKRLKEKYNL